MFDVTNSIHVPKRDLLSVIVSLPPGNVNGCTHCSKTILWNGGTWVHVNDQRTCTHVRCAGAWVEGKTQLVDVESFFRSTKMSAPVARCSRCGTERAAWYIGGKWVDPLFSECPAAVATPAGPVADQQAWMASQISPTPVGDVMP